MSHFRSFLISHLNVQLQFLLLWVLEFDCKLKSYFVYCLTTEFFKNHVFTSITLHIKSISNQINCRYHTHTHKLLNILVMTLSSVPILLVFCNRRKRY